MIQSSLFKCKSGDHIWARPLNGQYYFLAIVDATRTSSNSIKVKFPGNNNSDLLPASSLLPLKTGESCYAHWPKDKSYHAATFEGIGNKDNTVKVTYTESGESANVHQGAIYKEVCSISSNFIRWSLANSVIATMKGFILGYGIKVSISLFRCLLKFSRPRDGYLKLLRDRDHLDFGMFLASGIGSFNLLYWPLRKMRGKKDGINAAIAGFIASFGMLFDSSKNATSRRLTFALYTGVRAMSFLSKKLYLCNDFFQAPLWQHSDSAIFTIACSEIMFDWFYYPKRLPAAYNHWITKMSCLDQEMRQALHMVHHGTIVEGVKTDFLRDWCLQRNVDPREADFTKRVSRYAMCYPYDSYIAMLASRWLNNFKMSVFIYTPVHLLPLLLFKFKLIKERPLEVLFRLAKNSVMSSLFLSTFIFILISNMCIWRVICGTDKTIGPTIGGCLAGVSIFLEKKSRRKELAMYVLPIAIHSWWKRGCDNGIIKPIKKGEVIVFALACSIVAYVYESCPPAIGSSLYWLIKKILGNIEKDPRNKMQKN